MEDLKIGDLVEVADKGLAILRRICPNEKPNHHGKVAEIWDSGEILVEFPIGEGSDAHSQVAPYPRDKVTKREQKRN